MWISFEIYYLYVIQIFLLLFEKFKLKIIIKTLQSVI